MAPKPNLSSIKHAQPPVQVDVVGRREKYFRRMEDLLGPEDLLLMPTTPTLAPLKGTPGNRLAAADIPSSY